MAKTTLGCAVFLEPGQLYLSDVPTSVKTVLGSCVAVTFRAPRLGFAAMTHCLLPDAGACLRPLPESEAPRYVNSAIELILRRLAALGISNQELEVKLFGGAGRDGLQRYAVGRRNVARAKSVLARYGISPLVTVTGGGHGMSIEFDTDTGEVRVKRLCA